MLDRQHDLENHLRRAGNTKAQIKFWMTICLEMDGEEDGDLRSVVATDAALATVQGYLVVG